MVDPADETPLTKAELVLARRGSALIAAAMAHPEASAPQGLRESLARPSTTRGRIPRRSRLLVAAAGLTSSVALALALILGGSPSGSSGPSVVQVLTVARASASSPAPAAVTGGGRARLAAEVQGLSFPDWTAAFGWEATGSRRDRIGGRSVTTVFYREQGGQRLGYAIVAGRPLRPLAGRNRRRAGTRYRVQTGAGRTTVSWVQAGHSCVIDAPASVSTEELLRLASWPYA